MINKAHLQALLAYNAWAHDAVFRRLDELGEAERTRERPNVVPEFRTIMGVLNHSLCVDIIWKAHMDGRPHEFDTPRGTVHEDFVRLWQTRQDMDETLERALGKMEGDALRETVSYTLHGGNKGSMSRAMIFTHLATHGSYHRGWIAAILTQDGLMPAITDLPVYERVLRESGGAPLP